MKTLIISFLVISFFGNGFKDKLTGRWQSPPSETGAVTGIVFKNDSTFEGYVNKKPFTTGTYKLKGEVFSFVDNGCNGIEGVYKTIFFSSGDSLRFEAINDECEQRRNGIHRLVFGRTKE